jgi:hypothetical protein
MSGWIKLEKHLPEKEEVWRMAEHLKTDRLRVVGALVAWFVWLDDNTANGTIKVPMAAIDEIVRQQGFAAALTEVGWLRQTAGSLEVPNWSRHNGTSAKSRAQEQRTTASRRSAKADSEPTPSAEPVGILSASETDKEPTREEKIRDIVIQTSGAPPAEGKENPSKPTQTPDAKRVSKAKVENPADAPVFRALVEACGARIDEVTGPARFRYGKAVAEIRAATPGVTADEIRRRAARYRDRFPRWALTAHALAKHWSQVGPAEHDHAAASAAAAADPDAPVQMPRYPKA